MLPQSYIEKLKSSISIKDLIEEYTPLKKSSNNLYIGTCPNPNHKDKTPSLRVWIKTNSFACMTCHCGKRKGSDVIAFIQWIEKLSFIEAVKFLADKYNIPIPESEHKYYIENKKVLANIYHRNLLNNLKPLSYLKKRGLDIQDIQTFKIGWDGERITFPLFDKYKEILGFTRRKLVLEKKCTDKYVNTYNNLVFNKSKYMYGLHTIDKSFNEIRIVEGPMDKILSDKYKAKNVVAILGTAFTDNHINIIKSLGLIPVFCLDGDEAGLEKAISAIEKLDQHNIYSKILLIEKGDMADLALEQKDNLEEYINLKAVTYGTYLVGEEIKKCVSKILEYKLQSYPNFVNILNRIPNIVERQLLKDQINNILNIKIKGDRNNGM